MKTELAQPRSSSVGLALCIVSIAAGIGARFLWNSQIAAAGPIVLGFYLLFAIRIADQWEKVAVLRFGRYRGLRGPGLFHIIPLTGVIKDRLTDTTPGSARNLRSMSSNRAGCCSGRTGSSRRSPRSWTRRAVGKC